VQTRHLYCCYCSILVRSQYQVLLCKTAKCTLEYALLWEQATVCYVGADVQYLVYLVYPYSAWPIELYSSPYYCHSPTPNQVSWYTMYVEFCSPLGQPLRTTKTKQNRNSFLFLLKKGWNCPCRAVRKSHLEMSWKLLPPALRWIKEWFLQRWLSYALLFKAG